MTEDKKYDICIMPGNKTRLIAGPYDLKTCLPRYEVEIDIPNHVRNRVDVNQFLIGTPENCQWAYDIKNNSTWPVFVTIMKDGKTNTAGG